MNNIMLAHGIRKDNGEMVYGQVIKGKDGKIYITKDDEGFFFDPNFGDATMFLVEIKPETLGYATGIKDENGKDIHMSANDIQEELFRLKDLEK